MASTPGGRTTRGQEAEKAAPGTSDAHHGKLVSSTCLLEDRKVSEGSV